MTDSFRYDYKVPMHIIRVTKNDILLDNINLNNQSSNVIVNIQSVPAIVSRQNVGTLKKPIYSYFCVTMPLSNEELIIYDSNEDNALNNAIINYLSKDLNSNQDETVIYAIDVRDFTRENYMCFYDEEVKRLIAGITNLNRRQNDLRNYVVDKPKNAGRKLLRIPKLK